jgi:hypothetical protein
MQLVSIMHSFLACKHAWTDLDHEAQQPEVDTLSAEQFEGSMHLLLTLVDPAAALHEARELFQAARRGGTSQWHREVVIGKRGKGNHSEKLMSCTDTDTHFKKNCFLYEINII